MSTRPARRRGAAVAVAIAVPSVWLHLGAADACTGAAVTVSAIPRQGASAVPTDVKPIVFGAGAASAVITAGSAVVPVATATPLGEGLDAVGGGHAYATRLTLATPLPPTTTITIALDGVTLSQFTTGAAPSAATISAPIAQSVQLWSEDFSPDQIYDDCVVDELYGYGVVGYAPATFSDTPVDSVVHVLTLTSPDSAEESGSTLTFPYAGATPFVGYSPSQGWPGPADPWYPFVDAGTQYCFTVHAYGYATESDSATTTPVCTIAASIEATGGSPAPPVVDAGFEAGNPNPADGTNGTNGAVTASACAIDPAARGRSTWNSWVVAVIAAAALRGAGRGRRRRPARSA